MKTYHVRSWWGILLIAIAVIFCIPANAEYAERQASVDELFEFFLDNWLKPHIDSMEEAPGIGGLDDPVNVNFLKEVKKAKDEFGHLGEYWELRSFIDLREEDRNRGTSMWNNIDFTTPYHLFMEINPLMLKRAIRADETRAAAYYSIGQTLALDAWPDHEDGKMRFGETPVEHWEVLSEWLAKAREADQYNGYYPLMESTSLNMLGDLDGALELMKTAGHCPQFSLPMLFPHSYFIDELCDFKDGIGAFEGIDYNQRRFITDHYFMRTVPGNLIELRRGFRNIIADALERGDWEWTFNVLLRAAAGMGMSDMGDPIIQLNALSLIKSCVEEAKNIAYENEDKDLELALLAMFHEMETIKSNLRMEMKMEDRNAVYMRPILEELLSNPEITTMDGLLGDFANYYGGDDEDTDFVIQLDIILTDALTCALDVENNQVFSEKFLWHRFERIKTFDFSDPAKWYDWWLTKGRMSPPKDSASYREDCFT